MHLDYEAIQQAESLSEQLKRIRADQSLSESVSALDRKVMELQGKAAGFGAHLLTTAEGRSLSALNSALSQLLTIAQGADVAPTTQTLKMFHEVKQTLDQQLQGWNEVKSKDVPALNEKLRQANLPLLTAETFAVPQDHSREVEKSAGEEEP
jgi:hypothetical protein